MNTQEILSHEAAEDVFFGQSVMIWARWSIIFASTVLMLWSASTVGELTIKTLLIIALMATNFFLHGRYLMERPANPALLVCVSLLDVFIITTMVMSWPGQTGLASQLFVFYYPVLVAFAFVFPPRLSSAYTGVVLLAYFAACLLVDSSFLGTAVEAKQMVMRLITFAAVGGLATYFWRIQRRRRLLVGGGLGLADLRDRLAASTLAK